MGGRNNKFWWIVFSISVLVSIIGGCVVMYNMQIKSAMVEREATVIDEGEVYRDIDSVDRRKTRTVNGKNKEYWETEYDVTWYQEFVVTYTGCKAKGLKKSIKSGTYDDRFEIPDSVKPGYKEGSKLSIYANSDKPSEMHLKEDVDSNYMLGVSVSVLIESKLRGIGI